VRLYLRSRDRRPDPEPLPTNDRTTVLIGMGLWALLWVGAFVFHDQLDAAGRGWWIWTPPTGIVLGLLGLVWVRSNQRHRDEGR
jgi:hypothetical protein